jgi:peptidyl-prolyl cis-trans isomerase C
MARKREPEVTARSAFVRRAAKKAALALAVACFACHGSGARNAPKPTAIATPSAAIGADGSPVLAELAGHVLTLREFDERLSRQPLALRAQFKSVEARRHLLDDMVRLDLLAAEARRRKIDRLPEIRDRISELLAEELMNEVLTTNAKPGDVSDADVQAYYDSHAAEFHVPEERSAIVAVFDRRDRADETLRQAAAHPHDEAFFLTLAPDDRHDPTLAAQSGDSGFFAQATAGRLPAEARDAVFEMHAIGDVHPVVASNGAFYVLMLAGIRPALVREPKDVATLVRERLRAERRNRASADFIDGLRERAKVRIHAERLGATATPTPSTSASAARTD